MLYPDKCRKTIDIIYAGAVIWNSIPTMLRNITSRKKFSRDLKKNLLEEHKAQTQSFEYTSN